MNLCLLFKEVYKRSIFITFVEHNETSHLHNETSDFHNLTCSSCDAIYGFVQELLVHLNVTTPCCLGNSSACDVIDEGSEPNVNTRTDPAKGIEYYIHCSKSALGRVCDTPTHTCSSSDVFLNLTHS